MDYEKKYREIFDLFEQFEAPRGKTNRGKLYRLKRFIQRLFGKDEEKEQLKALYFNLYNIVFMDCPYIFHLDMFFKSEEDAELYCAENGVDLDWIE